MGHVHRREASTGGVRGGRVPCAVPGDGRCFHPACSARSVQSHGVFPPAAAKHTAVHGSSACHIHCRSLWVVRSTSDWISSPLFASVPSIFCKWNMSRFDHQNRSMRDHQNAGLGQLIYRRSAESEHGKVNVFWCNCGKTPSKKTHRIDRQLGQGATSPINKLTAQPSVPS